MKPSQVQKQTQKETQMAYFKEVLRDAGVCLRYDDQLNILTKEQSLVIRDMEKIMKSHISYPNNAQEFLEGLNTLLGKDVYFRKALMPTQLQKIQSPAHSGSIIDGIQQESILRLFLNINCLQNEVVEILVEAVATHAAEDSEDTSFVRLLLEPLRFLSFINDSTKLTIQLLDILEVATFPAQLEILNLIPEIIPDNKYEKAAEELIKLMDGRDELIGAIIDCLNCLNLTSNIRSNVQNYILKNFLTASSLKVFPILFEFLITDCAIKNLPNILMNARNAADMIMASEKCDPENASNKVTVFKRLHSFARSRKNVCDGWINVITSIQTHQDHKPIDLLVLFMLYSTGNSRKRLIENTFKRRIRTGFFKPSLLENLFKSYLVPQILKDHLNSFIEIGSCLLHIHGDMLLIDFASLLYKMLFMHTYVEYTQRQDILRNLLLLINTNDTKIVTPILDILSSLLEDHRKLQLHVLQIMSLLEKIDTFELKNVKDVFDLLCSLTCSENADESQSGLKDEIHMLIRKQLSSSKTIIKHQGIIAAIIMVKHIIITTTNQHEISLSDTITVADLPNGVPSEAASLLELTKTCTLGCSESVGLYYDELASMLATPFNLNNNFMCWLYQLLTNDFQNIFIGESVGDPINDVPITLKYSLNSVEEQDSPIAINVAELTMKPKNITNNVMVTLAPFFRLLRLTHFRYHNGILESIDALLGCSVTMPDTEDLNHYNMNQVSQIADCIFHCINWFREVISAFVTQKSKKLRNKVIERLNNLIELEQQLEKCLLQLPKHTLPVSYFDLLSQNSKKNDSPIKTINVGSRAKKRTRLQTITTNTNETSSVSIDVTQQKSQTNKIKSKVIKRNQEVRNFREIDTDIIVLLKYPLKIDENVDPAEVSSLQVTTLNIEQFQFLIKDLVAKLKLVTSCKNVGLSHINIIKPDHFISDCSRLMPFINKHFDAIVLAINQLLEKVDGCENASEIFKDHAHNLKISFGMVLEFYSLIFGWPGFQHTKHRNLLRDCLKSIQCEQQSQIIPINRLISEFAGKLHDHINQCLYLSIGVYLVQTLQAFHILNMNADMKKKISVVSEKLLSKMWYNSLGNEESGKNANLNIEHLIKAYLSSAKVQTVCCLIGTLQIQAAELKTKDSRLQMLKTIDKTNFYIFYRNLCNRLLEALQTEITSLTNAEHLILWQNTTVAMKGLMTIARIQETKANLLIFLKKSIGILKIFLSDGIPMLEIMLCSKPDDVVAILKTMQTSTRFLHHLCCYSKFTKETTIIAYVPAFRQTLESLLYRVKAALVANKCSDAFWMGTLKNKDLQGEDILSQSSINTDDKGGEERSDEELPQDDESDEELIAESSLNKDGSSSASEVF